MNILIIGCGKLGSRLANTFFRHGHDVAILDLDEDNFNRLDDDFDGLTVTGMAMDMSVLRNAGVEGCDAAAVVTSDDNLNITVSQILKEFFGIENVVARITDPSREKVFTDFGLPTVCQTNLTSSAIFSAITHASKEKNINVGTHTIGVNMKEVDHIFIGRSLDAIPVKTGEFIMGVLRANGEVELYDGRQEIILSSKDKIMFMRVND